MIFDYKVLRDELAKSRNRENFFLRSTKDKENNLFKIQTNWINLHARTPMHAPGRMGVKRFSTDGTSLKKLWGDIDFRLLRNFNPGFKK